MQNDNHDLHHFNFSRNTFQGQDFKMDYPLEVDSKQVNRNKWRHCSETSEDSGVSSLCDEESDEARPIVTQQETNNQVTTVTPIDESLQPFELPSRRMQARIIQQVEYYFSDDYLARDAYFLRQIRRKKEGYLSTKLITNFKKVRKMVNDVRVTSYCLRKSTELQVNEEGTKVRRIKEVPQNIERFFEQHNNKTVAVSNIPRHHANMNHLMAHFRKYGELTSVKIIKAKKYTELPQHFQAEVEFEKVESANKAVEDQDEVYKVGLLMCKFNIENNYTYKSNNNNNNKNNHSYNTGNNNYSNNNNNKNFAIMDKNKDIKDNKRFVEANVATKHDNLQSVCPKTPSSWREIAKVAKQPVIYRQIYHPVNQEPIQPAPLSQVYNMWNNACSMNSYTDDKEEDDDLIKDVFNLVLNQGKLLSVS